jgi:hypothetical protein
MKERSFSIFHFPFSISDLGIVYFLFVSVRVISWIVLFSRPKQTFHELTLSST